ncbi:putative ribonuclease H-like domain-containing protein [Tanacetum coccineum]|uniref:Ribonuclease H-like domain-containing protein n=1 Tax=Tanacetum coccineum TaxID=301880 RepID=A0ABQ5DBF2_9ASTR
MVKMSDHAAKTILVMLRSNKSSDSETYASCDSSLKTKTKDFPPAVDIKTCQGLNVEDPNFPLLGSPKIHQQSDIDNCWWNLNPAASKKQTSINSAGITKSCWFTGAFLLEFKKAKLIELCGEKGIKRDYSNPRTPQQNRIAERKNRTLIEAAKTHVADSKILPSPSSSMVPSVMERNAIMQKSVAKHQRQEYEAKHQQHVCDPAVVTPAGSFQPAGSYETCLSGNSSVNTSVSADSFLYISATKRDAQRKDVRNNQVSCNMDPDKEEGHMIIMRSMIGSLKYLHELQDLTYSAKKKTMRLLFNRTDMLRLLAAVAQDLRYLWWCYMGCENPSFRELRGGILLPKGRLVDVYLYIPNFFAKNYDSAGVILPAGMLCFCYSYVIKLLGSVFNSWLGILLLVDSFLLIGCVFLLFARFLLLVESSLG